MADVVKFSDDELLLLTQRPSLEQGLISVKELNIPLIVITQSAKGALVITAEMQTMITGKAVKPIDTTGAGDAFVGGLLCQLSLHKEWFTKGTIINAVQWANSCGALATTQKGAMTALPDKHMLDQWIG